MAFLEILDNFGGLTLCILVGGLSAKSAYVISCIHRRGCTSYGLSAWLLTMGATVLVLALVGFEFLFTLTSSLKQEESLMLGGHNQWGQP